MQYKSIAYRRIKNLGNFESATIEVSAALNPGDDLKEAIDELRNNVDKILKVGKYLPPEQNNDDDDNKDDYF